MGNKTSVHGGQNCWYLTTVQAVDARGRLRFAAVVVTPHARHYAECGERLAPPQRCVWAAEVLRHKLEAVPWYRWPRRVRCATSALATQAGDALQGTGVLVRADAKGQARYAEAQALFEAHVAADDSLFRRERAA